MSENTYSIHNYDHTFDAGLAQMWNESDDQWPGTFTNGVPLNEKRVQEWMDRVETIVCFIVVENETGKVVGYGDLWDTAVRPNSCYVALLNVHPEHQGRSLARLMLVEMVEWSVANNYDRITIGTWPANLKAMPLYKKVGFFWKPDTSVFMENYLPAARLLPAAKSFFERHDWYKTYDRDLSQVEDGNLHPCLGDMKVYTLRWQEGDEYLETVFDRNAQKLTGIETNEWAAYARATDPEPGQGIRYSFEWEFFNKTEQPLHIKLQASADEGIEMDFDVEFDLQGGANKILQEDFRVALDAPKYKGHHEDIPTPLVHTKLQLNGTALELGTGLRYTPALEISLFPVETTLTPGVSQSVLLQIRNHTKIALDGFLSLDLPEGLTADWADKPFSAPAEGFVGVSVDLVAQEGGFFPLMVQLITDVTGKLKPKPLPVTALSPGSWTAGVGDDEMILENDFFRIAAKARAGEAVIFNKDTHEVDARLFEEIGPPYVPWDLHEKDYDLHLQTSNGEAKAILTVRSNRFPGLVVGREITLNASPLIRVRGWVSNNTEEAFEDLILRPHMRLAYENRREIIVPLKEGIIFEQASQFGGAEQDVPKELDRYAENWIAYQDQGRAAGVIWLEGQIKELLVEDGRHFMFIELPIQPGETRYGAPLYYYSGPGDWRAVQQAWRRMSGISAQRLPITNKDDVRTHLALDLDPVPLWTLDGHVETDLRIETTREYKLKGELKVQPPKGWSVTPSETVFEIDHENPKEVTLTLDANNAVERGPHSGELVFESQAFDRKEAFRVFRLGDSTQSVAVSSKQDAGNELYTIQNGHAQWTVAPDFHGGVIAWNVEEADTNHLMTSYPDEGELSWMKPFFGGIRPLLYDLVKDSGWPGKLHEESFAAEPHELLDEHGLTWQGLRLKAEVQEESFRGMQVELDYLTLPGSRILQTKFRLINKTPVYRKVQLGWHGFAQVSGSHANAMLHTQVYSRKRTPHMSWDHTTRWTAIENPDTGLVMVVVPASGKRSVHAIDMGDYGAHVIVREDVDVPASEIVEERAYFILAESIEKARMYVDLV